MIIKFDKKSGRIISICMSEPIKPAESALSVDEADLPKDFMKTFAYGKYFIRKGKLTANTKFSMPRKKAKRIKIEP